MDTFFSLMAAGILFIVILQRQAPASKFLSFYFEAIKSGCATGVWIWMMSDSIFKEHEQDKYRNPQVARRARIGRTAISGVILL